MQKLMFSQNENHRYYLCALGTDMHKGFNILSLFYRIWSGTL
jgi:hypothetical protein